MDVSHPLRGLLTPAMAGVIEVLTATHTPLTGREVHRLIRGDVSLGATQQALASLESLGLVDTQPAGRAQLHTFNREHVLAEALLSLVGAPSTLEEWLASAIQDWPQPPVAAWLFGSAARGEATAQSDIDVVFVGPAGFDVTFWDEPIAILSEAVLRRTGNAMETLVLTENELEDSDERGDRLIDELRQDARPLVGPSPREVLRPRAAS
ncbi:hypothetical protein BJY21_002010 [Kineosphaera limosa]|uniref:Polymerase nucleotidyl transferase domain-containing protein n=1 Tax=Kineosphaera limosa NBRC 100340 TaxID=1184609 RepID=K6VL64_9MICO|nr:nucleotidyltransferase domain-containing protein [Kineosphaera limosa]NYE00826.1 hypothetical protein [Kineosphaera limosa]GAB96953.1 hypothetical protein KILIM_053_00040 [Kineosphaera limosa NBRC 100340]